MQAYSLSLLSLSTYFDTIHKSVATAIEIDFEFVCICVAFSHRRWLTHFIDATSNTRNFTKKFACETVCVPSSGARFPFYCRWNADNVSEKLLAAQICRVFCSLLVRARAYTQPNTSTHLCILMIFFAHHHKWKHCRSSLTKCVIWIRKRKEKRKIHNKCRHKNLHQFIPILVWCIWMEWKRWKIV